MWFDFKLSDLAGIINNGDRIKSKRGNADMIDKASLDLLQVPSTLPSGVDEVTSLLWDFSFEVEFDSCGSFTDAWFDLTRLFIWLNISLELLMYFSCSFLVSDNVGLSEVIALEFGWAINWFVDNIDIPEAFPVKSKKIQLLQWNGIIVDWTILCDI